MTILSGNISKNIKEFFPLVSETKNLIAHGVIGDDTKGNGRTHPFKTIQKAVNTVQFPADIYLYETFTEDVTLTNSKSNCNFIGSKLYGRHKVEVNGRFITSSANANNRFVRLGITGVKIKAGTAVPVTLGSFDGGKHSFENVAFETSNANIISIPSNFNSSDGTWLNFLNCNFSGAAASVLTLPDLDGTNTATIRLYNCGFLNISVGKGWTVYYHGDTVLNITNKHASALIVDLPRCFRMTSIITSQAALTALIAITDNSANGAYLINFTGPTGITGIAAGDIILKNGSIHMITMKYADAPAQVIDFVSNVVYIKKGTLWGSLGTAAYLAVGTGANQIVQLDANAKLPAVDGSNLTNVVASDLSPSTPYSVNSAKTDSNGYALFITKIDNSTVGFDTNSSSVPIKITYPDGSTETNNSLPNITGILTDGTYYIVKEKGANPYTSHLPVEDIVAPSTPATGQLWLDISVIPYIPKKWNGSAWVVTQFVKLGEFVKTSGVIGTPISYALNRTYVLRNGTNLTVNHNIGTRNIIVPQITIRCISAANGYSVGDLAILSTFLNGNATFAAGYETGVRLSRNSIILRASSFFVVLNQITGLWEQPSLGSNWVFDMVFKSNF